MFDANLNISDPVKAYKQNGFTIIKIFTEKQVCELEQFAINWINRLLYQNNADNVNKLPLGKYHLWYSDQGINHESIFCAKNRHICPEESINKILLSNKILIDFLCKIGIIQYNIWDEGLGWLGFRFIRPGFNDGYPFSRKEWGIAKNVVSCWVPIIGYSPKETLTLVPGSHLKEFNKYLPEDNKFRKDEFRLVDAPKREDLFNPQLERGEIILYHPRLLHSENVMNSDLTRLSLEYRIDPRVKI